MKKYRILMGAMALALVIVFIVVACNKERAISANEDEVMLVSNEDDMSAYLKRFKEKMQSATKSDETLSMEEARWHLEAVLNYTYGEVGNQTSDIQRDTLYFEMNVNGEEISLGQLNEAYASLSNDVQKVLCNCNLPDKSILAIQTSFENENKGGNILIKSVVSVRGVTTMNLWFDSTDYWNERYCDYGLGCITAGGKCGPYMGESTNSGAPLELTRKLIMRIPFTGCPNGGYFTDLELVEVSPVFEIDDFIWDENSPRQYKIYCRTEDPHFPELSNPDGCICPEDMNYYLSKGLELIEHYKPEGKVVMSAYYYSDEIMSEDTNCFHVLVIQYGILHCNVIEDF